MPHVPGARCDARLHQASITGATSAADCAARRGADAATGRAIRRAVTATRPDIVIRGSWSTATKTRRSDRLFHDLLQMQLRNRLKLHVAGAFVNHADLGVAVELFHRVLAAVTVTAEKLYGLSRDPV